MASLLTDPRRGYRCIFSERMAARLLAAVARPNAAECTKGRFFDRASDKLNQLAKFATNELVSFDLQTIASSLGDNVTPIPDSASPNLLLTGLSERAS